MKLRTGKVIGYEISRGADYILLSVNVWRAFKKNKNRFIFMEVIDKFGCYFFMTNIEY